MRVGVGEGLGNGVGVGGCRQRGVESGLRWCTGICFQTETFFPSKFAVWLVEDYHFPPDDPKVICIFLGLKMPKTVKSFF